MGRISPVTISGLALPANYLSVQYHTRLGPLKDGPVVLGRSAFNSMNHPSECRCECLVIARSLGRMKLWRMKRPRESLSAVASVNGGEYDIFEPLAQLAVHTVGVPGQRLSSSSGWRGSHPPASTDYDADEQ
jgi:hypothetical protein